MLLAPTGQLGPITMIMNPGDIINTNENTYSLSGAGNITALGRDLTQGDIFISGGAAINFTLPSADDLVKQLAGSTNLITPPGNALYGNLPSQSVQLAWPANLMPINPYSSYRRSIMNANSATVTSVAPATSGVSLLRTTTIITVNWREFLVRILNSSPLAIVSATTTNATFVLSNIDLTLINNIGVGMSVYGTGIGAAAVVTAINRDLGTVTVSVASTASASNIAVTFTPTYTWEGLRSGTV